MALPVAGIVAYFDGAVGALVLLYVSETCSRWEAPRLLGEDAGSPGCQHPQFNQSPQRKLPLSPTGPLDHQRRMAGLSEVQKNPFLLVVYIDLWVPSSKIFGGSFIHYARSHVVRVVMDRSSTFLSHSGNQAVQFSILILTEVRKV